MFHIDIHPGASLGILYDDNIHDNSDVHDHNDDDDDDNDENDNAHLFMCQHTQYNDVIR